MGRHKNWRKRAHAYMFIRVYMHQHGKAPTGYEIAQAIHFNHQKIYGILRDLEARGMIVLTGGQRGIALPEKS